MTTPLSANTPQDVLLIHGTWGHGTEWEEFGAALGSRGFRWHAPSLPEHGHPRDIDIWGSAQRVSRLGLTDYVDSLVGLVAEMATPPIIVGHSLGGLLAQLVAARVPHRGVVLLGTAPAAGIFAFYPSQVALWSSFIPRWILGRPMYPIDRKRWDRYICNTIGPDYGEEFYADLCAESGTAYRQMVLWPFDRTHASRVDHDRVTGPVLVVVGAEDKCTVPGMSRSTAKRYGDRATYVELPGTDHMIIGGPQLAPTLEAIDQWLGAQSIASLV